MKGASKIVVFPAGSACNHPRLITLLACLFWGLLSVLLMTQVSYADEPQAYIDQLIDPGSQTDSVDPEYQLLMEQPPGRRYFSAEFLQYIDERDATGLSRETGAQLSWRQETLNYGEFEAEGSLLGVSAADNPGGGPSSGGSFTIRQHDFSLDNDRVMQNSLGVDRSTVDSLISNSYRIKLPSTLLLGVNSRVSSATTDLQFGAGRVGSLATGQLQTFEKDPGNLFSTGFVSAVNARLRAGVQLVSANGLESLPDHQSVAGALQYRTGDGSQQYQGHALADSLGNTGYWVDGDSLLGRWRNRFGAFRIAPDLLWTDSMLASDQQGFYARSDLRLLSYQLGGGLDYTETDINNDPVIIGTRSSNLFLNANRRLTRLTSAGGALNIRDTRPESGGLATALRDARLSLFTAHDFSFGTSRLQVEAADIRNGTRHGYGEGITWDQGWHDNSRLRLSSTLGYETEQNTGNDMTRYIAGLLVYHDFSSVLRWDANINWTRAHDEIAGSYDDSVSGSLSLLWQFLPGWEASLRALDNVYNQQAPGNNSVTAVADQERSVLLSVRYTRASGRPFERYGRDTGKSGYGTVSGELFFDENHDGVRQAGEAAAAGVYVYLDRRYQQVTDRSGRFTFNPVAAGDHSVSIAQEDLPLPWGLDDERPRAVTVKVREDQFIQLPLVRSDE